MEQNIESEVNPEFVIQSVKKIPPRMIGLFIDQHTYYYGTPPILLRLSLQLFP